MKKTLALLSISILLAITLISCGAPKDSGDSQTTTAAPVTTAPAAATSTDISGYKIIRKDSASAFVKQFYARVRTSTEKYAGVKLDIGTDFAKTDAEIDNSSAQILIGNTNRQASIDALAELETKPNSNYMISFRDNKIVIVGKDEKALVMAIKAFEERVIEKSESTGTFPIKEGYKYFGNETYDRIFDNGVTIKTEYVREISGVVPSAQYPTLLVLEHNGENNGTMFATYEGANFEILTSTNDGRAWKKASSLSTTKSKNGYTPLWMPCLYELPADIGDFKEGTIVFSCTTATAKRNGNDFTESAISIYASTDLCKTWTAVSEVAIGGGVSDDTGVWEPCFLYEEKSGRLYCFYSDDSDPAHSQKLVCKWTTDLLNWSELIDNVTVPQQYMRPGMTTVAKMNNGKYFIAYELGLNEKEGGFPVYYNTTDNLDAWDYEECGIHLVTEDGVSYGSSPWCAYSPVAGPNGALFVIGGWQMTGKSETGSNMAVSFDYGKTFESIPNFFDMSGGNGYSPWLHFSEDGKTLYYVSCPSAGGSNKSVTMAKVTVKK